jgi:hypothetical protein
MIRRRVSGREGRARGRAARLADDARERAILPHGDGVTAGDDVKRTDGAPRGARRSGRKRARTAKLSGTRNRTDWRHRGVGR